MPHEYGEKIKFLMENVKGVPMQFFLPIAKRFGYGNSQFISWSVEWCSSGLSDN
jgi:hypothetical protein